MFIDFLLDVFKNLQKATQLSGKTGHTHTDGSSDASPTGSPNSNVGSVKQGEVVSIEADFSPNAVALLLAIIERGVRSRPSASSVEMHKDRFLDIACVDTDSSLLRGQRDFHLEKPGRSSVTRLPA